MSKLPKKLSDTTRSHRRRAARLKQMSAREQRWRDACLVFEAGLKILCGCEDALIHAKFQAIIKEVDKYLANKQSDEQIVFKAIKSGAWLVTEIAEETGLPTLYVQKLLRTLCKENKVQRLGNYYKPVEI